MKRLSVFPALVLLASCAETKDPEIPVASGTYQYHHRDAEFSTQTGFPVDVTISGSKYSVAVQRPGQAGAMCPLYSGTLMWNEKVQKWVLGNDESDRTASEAGGCQGDGPDSIDFEKKIIWTCVGESIVEGACADH